MPPGKNRLLIRRKVIRQLVRAVGSHRLVVAVSPMGYGKTTVAQQFRERAKPPAYFYSVPADSRGGDEIWDDLWRELAGQGLRKAAALRRMGFPETDLNRQYAVDLLAGMPPAVVVLDDYHNCPDSAMNAFIETAARDGRDNCRFLIFSRTIPEMNFRKMQRRGTAVLYDQTLLAFSETEAREYFFLNDVTDASAAADAWKYSEGWAAALWLSLRSSKWANKGSSKGAGKGAAKKGAESAPFVGDIEARLDSVVYSPYSRAEKAMLMQLSVLDCFSSAEAETLTRDKNAGRRLARIMNRNAFITRDAVRRKYQFHSIFRTFLQKRLAADAELNSPDLHRLAAECHTARGEFMMAFRNFARAGQARDSESILELFERHGNEMRPDNRWDEVHGIVRSIPWSIRLRRPFGYISYLWMLVYMDNRNFDPALLREAEKRFNAARNITPENRKRLAGELEYLRGFLAFNDTETMFRHYRRAGKLLAGRPSCVASDGGSWTGGSPFAAFIGYNRPGRFHLGKDLTKNPGMEFVAVTDEIETVGHVAVEAEYQVELGELISAEQLLDVLDERIDMPRHITSFIVASFSRARLLAARGEAAKAVALLRGAVPGIEKTDMFEQILAHDMALGYILATVGRTDGMPRWLADGNVYDPPYGNAYYQSFSLTVYGKILLARGDYDGLGKLIAGSPDGFGPFASPLSAIHIRIFEAIIAKRKRDNERALRALREALDLSRRDRIVLTYAEYDDKILPLLKRLLRERPDDPHLESVVAWCRRAGRVADSRSSYKLTILTARERAVMRLVVKGRTTPRIARELGVSATTVKDALKHAYGKLAAANRAEAAARFAVLYPQKGGRAARVAGGAGGGVRSLTRREREVLRMVGKGMSNSAVAAGLAVSSETVKTILASVYGKLGVSNRAQAAREFANLSK